MSEIKDKKRTTEWSFSFEQIGESISQFFGSLKGGDGELKVEQFNVPLDDATSAVVELGMAIGQVDIYALTDSENLMEAEVAHVGEMEFEVSGAAEKKVKLQHKRQKGVISVPFKEAIGAISSRDDLRWKVGLAPQIPLRLELNAGVGASHLDLSGLNLVDLELDAGVGEIHLTLPATEASYKASVDSGVGSTVITIAENAALTLSVDGGVGSTVITIPEGAAVRVQGDSGLGGIQVPDHFIRVRKDDDFVSKSGVWETEGFAVASRQIVIKYDGGVGGLRVK